MIISKSNRNNFSINLDKESNLDKENSKTLATPKSVNEEIPSSSEEWESDNSYSNDEEESTAMFDHYKDYVLNKYFKDEVGHNRVSANQLQCDDLQWLNDVYKSLSRNVIL